MAEGTADEKTVKLACSKGLKEAYFEHMKKTREELKQTPQSSKKWWLKQKELQRKSATPLGVPALRDQEKWVLDPQSKADLFAKTFAAKYVLPAEEKTGYSKLQANSKAHTQRGDLGVTEAAVEQELAGLKEDSATGPDLLPAKVLKDCSKELARPVYCLILLLLQWGVWPSIWMQHWIVPIYKKKAVFKASNYRGVHLTAQLSKVVERVLQKCCTPFLVKTVSFGPNQFAYTGGRGSRDALALLTLQWLQALAKGRKVAVYCSDVAGAFDDDVRDAVLQPCDHEFHDVSPVS